MFSWLISGFILYSLPIKLDFLLFLFNQSLNLELCNERDIGIAIDYTNLAIVEQKCGNKEKAKENINIAIKYAKDLDQELYEKIKDLLN